MNTKRSGGSLYWAFVMLAVILIGGYGTYARYFSASGVENRLKSERAYIVKSFEETESDYQEATKSRQGEELTIVQQMISREDTLREVEQKLNDAPIRDKSLEKKRSELLELSSAVRTMSESYRLEITKGGQVNFRKAKAQIPKIQALIKQTEM